MLIRNLVPFWICFSTLFVMALTLPYYLTIWHFVDHRRYEAFPEEDHVTLAYILGGNFMSRLLFMQHFKTVIKHSESFFRLHLITDPANREDVDTLLQTWNISNCVWYFHDLDKYEDRVKWIPNSHYSKYYGLTKLLIPEIIPDTVGKIMYVDIDMIFRSDIFYLWQKFRYFNHTQSIGMVENMSDWYLNKDGKKSVWPALGRGFNAGIIMMDLDKLRERDWRTRWREVANKYLKIHSRTTMSDQDIFNAYIHDHPDEIKSLPCEYNFQLGSMTKSEELCDETPLALHFNSQNKTVRKGYNLYNDIRKEAEGIDGSDLKRRRSVSKRAVFQDEKRNFCNAYLPADNFRVLPNSLGNLKKTAEICLVTQFSKERFSSFLENLKTWKYPISVAVFGKDEELISIVNVLKSLNRSDISLHLVFEDPRKPMMPENTYPINFLRNIAIKHANCKNLLLSDADFVILGDFSKLQEQSNDLKGRDILIIPAFESSVENRTDTFLNYSTTKEDFTEKVKNGKMQMFHEKIWPKANRATNISNWMNTNDVYNVTYENNYEPYFVIKKENCPLYDERFGGFGWNKVTHVMQLRMMNYTFKVSPSSFMIHRNHEASKSLSLWRKDIHYRECLHYLKKQFVEDTAKALHLTSQ